MPQRFDLCGARLPCKLSARHDSPYTRRGTRANTRGQWPTLTGTIVTTRGTGVRVCGSMDYWTLSRVHAFWPVLGVDNIIITNNRIYNKLYRN